MTSESEQNSLPNSNNLEQIKIIVFPDGRIDLTNTAKLLGLGKKTLYNSKNNLNMPRYFKVGGKIYYDYKKVIEWIEKEKEKTQI